MEVSSQDYGRTQTPGLSMSSKPDVLLSYLLMECPMPGAADSARQGNGDRGHWASAKIFDCSQQYDATSRQENEGRARAQPRSPPYKASLVCRAGESRRQGSRALYQKTNTLHT